MWEEVITDKKNEEHPVINSLFEIERKRRLWHIELDLKILSKNSDIEEYEWFFFGRNDLVSYFCLHSCTLGCKVTFLPAYSARSCATTLGEDVLTKYFKVRLMRSQGHHNQVSILNNHQIRLALSVSKRTKP